MKIKYFLSGVLILILAWGGPLPKLSASAFYAHMLMHMLVVAVAAPIIALGLPAVKNDSLLTAPIPASMVELIVVWGWHAPWPHHFARHETLGIILEQSMFIICGVWLWYSSFLNKAQGVIGLLLTSMHMTFLGALISLATRPLYQHHVTDGHDLLFDQQLGGTLMLIIGGISYFIGGIWLTVRLLKERPYEKMG